MWPDPQFPADLVTFTEEMLNGKLHFFAVIVMNLAQIDLLAYSLAMMLNGSVKSLL